MKDTVLLVVDVQTALIEEHPFNETGILINIRKLIETARRKNIEIIYIRHDSGIGGGLEQDTEGWEIHQDIAPEKHDKIFDKKFNSSFKDTRLREYLEGKGIKTIILVGMQTEYCIDTTCKVAFEYGYNVIIPEDTTTTYDNDTLSGKEFAKYYEKNIWNHRFAKVIPLSEVMETISGDTV